MITRKLRMETETGRVGKNIDLAMSTALVLLPSSLVGTGSQAEGSSGSEDTLSIVFDANGSPVPSGP